MSNVRVVVKGKARSRIALGVVTAYLRLHPNTTFSALKDAFPDSICPKAPVQVRSIVPLGVFQPLELVQLLPKRGLSIAHYILDSEILNTSDGVAIAVTKSWTQEAFDALTASAATHGINVVMVEGKWPSGKYELDFLDGEPKLAVAKNAKLKGEKNPSSAKKYCKLFAALAAALLLVAATLLVQRSDQLFSKQSVDTIVFDMDTTAPISAKKETKAAAATTAQSKPAAVKSTTPPRKKAVPQNSIAPKAKVKPQAASSKKVAQPKANPTQKVEAAPIKQKVAPAKQQVVADTIIVKSKPVKKVDTLPSVKPEEKKIAPVVEKKPAIDTVAKPKKKNPTPVKATKVDSAAVKKTQADSVPAKAEEKVAQPVKKEEKIDTTFAKTKPAEVAPAKPIAVDTAPAPQKEKAAAKAAPEAQKKEIVEKPQEQKIETQQQATSPQKPKKKRYTQRPLI
ncbi:MAG: hypothetical protein LBU92_01135 [Prevotellaceae bacterium]|jgi:hypothetical protein|nr:hypothetical protein [Prevotellaceae bacterium]